MIRIIATGLLLNFWFSTFVLAQEARLIDCTLEESSEFNDGKLKLYQADGFTHSILFEHTSEQGTLPALFICDSKAAQCEFFPTKANYRLTISLNTRITDMLEQKLDSVEISEQYSYSSWESKVTTLKVASCSIL
jgi:hypothetical protein